MDAQVSKQTLTEVNAVCNEILGNSLWEIERLVEQNIRYAKRQTNE